MTANPEFSLSAGLAALNDKDYETAKVVLEKVAAVDSKKSNRLQATIGLVVVYARTGNIPKAIALCETLAASKYGRVKKWASQTLEELQNYNLSDVDENSVQKYIDENKPTQAIEEQKNPHEPNMVTGFVTFENLAVLAQEEEEIIEQPEAKNTDEEPDIDTNKQKAGAAILAINNTKEPKQTIGQIEWQQAERAKVWQPQNKLNLIPLKLLNAGTIFALFWVIRELLLLLMGFINNALVTLPFLEPLQILYADPSVLLVFVFIAVTAVSPWLLDVLLVNFYGLRDLQKDYLEKYSSESARLLQRVSLSRKWKNPKLCLLPIAAPIAFTYGNLPRTARIVVSQGLLEQLEDDEIATIYASQLGHIAHWNFLTMSLVLLVTIPIYQKYLYLSEWGDSAKAKYQQIIATITSSATYILWCLLSGTCLCLSHIRLYYSDQFAAEITGNPNGLIRALLKIAIGIAGDISKQEQTSWQIESLNLLSPVGYQQSISLGSVATLTTFESYLAWEYRNPYRWYFAINNTHPLMGERIKKILEITKDWHLSPELNFAFLKSEKINNQSFLLHLAPIWGIFLGTLVALLFRLVWQIGFALKILNLTWIYDDWNYLTGCLLIGFSVGTFIRINALFPEIKITSDIQIEKNLPELLTNPYSIAVDSTKVNLAGKLIGRRGTSNHLGQDLILQSPQGLMKLHHISWMGQKLHPQQFIGRQVTITGWLRRGATPWLDIQTLQTQNRKTINSFHLIWSLVIALAATTWGAYILLTG